MRLTRKLVVAGSLLSLGGCRTTKYAPPESPMPANTVLMSAMMRELSAQPGFNEALIEKLNGGASKKGPTLLTPALMDELRRLIVGKDWAGLDRFPGWTMTAINPTVRTVGHFAGKSEKLEESSEVHPGAPVASAQQKEHLDLGPYALDKAETISLDKRSTLPAFDLAASQTKLGAGVVRGDGPNDLAPMQPESQRLADILNRLAANSIEGAKPFVVTVNMEEFSDPPLPPPPPRSAADYYRRSAKTPEELLTLLTASHTVTVTDSRYFANFAHLHYKGRDVMAPFWVNSQIVVPNSGGRPLLVPVSHAELEWHIRSSCCKPGINADVSYYFGIDGKAQWRVMDTLDQAWVLKRDAHTYTGADAIEVTRLTGLMTAAFMRLHAAHPTLPFGGYYALGVCQDGVSAIEHKMTGKVTLFPNTADLSLFNDPRDAEINGLFASIPKDRDGDKPEPERIFGSLPTDDFSKITIPGLAADLTAVHDAWKNGAIERTHTWWDTARAWVFIGSAIALAFFFAVKTRKFLDRNQEGPFQKNPFKK